APFVGGDSLDRQPRLLDQFHLRKLLVGLDGGKRDRLGQCLDGLEVDADELGAGVGGIRIMLADDLDDADGLLALLWMLETGAVAFLSLHQVLLGGVVAYAGPGLALGALGGLLVP